MRNKWIRKSNNEVKMISDEFLHGRRELARELGDSQSPQQVFAVVLNHEIGTSMHEFAPRRWAKNRPR